MDAQYYRRPLPPELVAFSSDLGRQVFREALAEGNMEGYFAVAEQYQTQAEPAFCGLGSLVVALNALAIDPGRLWQGPWRWFDEKMLDCCVPLEVVRQQGITMHEFGCLARCNGAAAHVVIADGSAAHGSIDDFRSDLAAALSRNDGVMVVSYGRQALGQTGDGHFSPIGGFCAARDLVLIMDVARFKYSPHWVKTTDLYAAMKAIDSVTGKPRGWVHLRRALGAPPILLRLLVTNGAGPAALVPLVDRLRQMLVTATDVAAVLDVFAELPPALAQAIGVLHDPARVPTEHAALTEPLRLALNATPLMDAIRASSIPATQQELVALFLLALPPAALADAAPALQLALTQLTTLPATQMTLRSEVAALAQQLAVVWCNAPSCAVA